MKNSKMKDLIITLMIQTIRYLPVRKNEKKKSYIE